MPVVLDEREAIIGGDRYKREGGELHYTVRRECEEDRATRIPTGTGRAMRIEMRKPGGAAGDVPARKKRFSPALLPSAGSHIR